MLLFLNTTQPINQILVAKNNQIIDYQEFDSKRDDLENTLPKIEQIFTANNLDKFTLKKIIVVNWPGSFIGIRVGLTIANTLLKFIPTAVGYTITQEKLVSNIATNNSDNTASSILNYCQKIINKQKGQKKLLPLYGREPNIGKV